MAIDTKVLDRLHETELTIARIDAKIDTTFTKLSTTVEHLDNSVKGLNNAINCMREVIFGGGDDSPLFSRVAVLENEARTQSEAMKKIADTNEKFLKEERKYRLGMIGVALLVIALPAILLISYFTDSNFAKWLVELVK